MKKKNKRKESKHPALNPNLNLKTRYELISDYDYLDKLSDKEKQYLNNFTEEYVNTNFKHEGKRIHKKEKREKRTRAGRKKIIDVAKNEAEARNNARNRCILTRAKASNMAEYFSDIEKKYKVEIEDSLIDRLDGKLEESDNTDNSSNKSNNNRQNTKKL